jgi:hypothetical protein
LNGGAAVQHPELTLPKPGARGSSPLRDANLHTISGVETRTGMNSRATGRRIHGIWKGFGTEERIRGYRTVTSPETTRRRSVTHPATGPVMPTRGCQVRRTPAFPYRRFGMLLQAAQRSPAPAMAKQPNDSCQAGGLARERGRETRQAPGEDAPITPPISTPPARQACANHDRCSRSGQTPKRSRVSPVTRFGLDTASRTGGPPPAVP